MDQNVREFARELCLETVRVNPGGMMAPQHVRQFVRLAREFFSELENPTPEQPEAFQQVAREETDD